MAEGKLAANLAALRRDLEKAQQQRATLEKEQIAREEAMAAEEKQAVDDLLEDMPDLAHLRDMAGDWLESLNEELKDTRPSTILLIFGLGVLVGRLSS